MRWHRIPGEDVRVFWVSPENRTHCQGVKTLARKLGFLALLTATSACAQTSPGTTRVPEALATLPKVSQTPRDSSHAQHVAQLQSRGVAGSPQAQRWIEEARRAVEAPLRVPVPLREIVHFDASQPLAAGFAMELSPGQTLYVRVRSIQGESTVPFLDLFAMPQGRGMQRVASTQGVGFQLTVSAPGRHVLRVQPPLGQGGRFEVLVERRASAGFSFPVQGKTAAHIGSDFGDPRDGGRRKHEGIDIFAERGTPVLAAAAGHVQQAGRNRLGGNIVWVGHEGGWSTYYAHLDRVQVREGQRVKAGDRLGTVGNTGNARNASPHLHFGMYQRDVARDPRPFMERDAGPPPIEANHAWLGTVLRVQASSAHLRSAPSTDAIPIGRLRRGDTIRPVAVREGWFRFRTADGRWGWMHESVLSPHASGAVAMAQGGR